MKGCVGCLETEKMGLLQLKSYLNSLLPSGQEESVLDTWSDDASNCCLWERVNCSDAIGGHIVHLSMNEILRMGPSGSLNLSLLHSFPQLQTLDFSGNLLDHLFDPIHGYKSFRRLEKLRTLDLSYNRFNNSALPFLGAAKSLRTLNLQGHRMEGVFPPNELANMTLTDLKVLNLYLNKFSSFSVPGVVFPSSLQVLHLGNNQLSSTLNGICAFKNLRELYLGYNALTNLPYCLGNLSHLRTLDLSENQLNGNLSSFVSGLPSALDYLSLLENNFNGLFLFKSLVNQTRLTVFKFSSNVGMIQAQAESSWVPLFQLKELRLRNVNLGSNIPSFLVHQHELGIIDLSGNKLTGAFPTWLVQTLLLNINDLSGEIPIEIGNLESIRSLNLSNNHLTGSIPDNISKLENLWSLDLSSNKLDGNIPPQLGDLGLEYFNVSFNNLSGEIPLEGYLVTLAAQEAAGNLPVPGQGTAINISDSSATNRKGCCST